LGAYIAIALVAFLVLLLLLGIRKALAGRAAHRALGDGSDDDEDDADGDVDTEGSNRKSGGRGKPGRKSGSKSGRQGGQKAGQKAGDKSGQKAPGRVGSEQATGLAEQPEQVGTAGKAPVGKPGDKALAAGLSKTKAGFISRIGELLRRKEIDQDLFTQLEEVLLTADIGVKTAQQLFEQVRSSLGRKELKDPEAVWAVIKEESQKLLHVDRPPVDFAAHKPFVLLVIGVNGAGKTTTIGKLAAQLTEQGRKVILAAGDTFRAAAVEQLEVWGQRAKVPVVRGKEGADPSSVIFEAIKRAQHEQLDVVIADTAGRLHVKEQLMAELQKVRRVIKKADPSAPHETWLVLDSTNGQNALAQAVTFKEAMEITGIILTKLDGTAKGGVILGIAHELGVPVRYIGVGEKIQDLRAFDAENFVDVLYDRAVM
jgi:fused signal recognition particle receptor